MTHSSEPEDLAELNLEKLNLKRASEHIARGVMAVRWLQTKAHTLECQNSQLTKENAKLKSSGHQSDG